MWSSLAGRYMRAIATTQIRLPAWARLLNLIVLVAPLVALAMMSVMYVTSEINRVLANPEAIATELGEMVLQRKVSVDILRVFPLGSLDAYNLRIADVDGNLNKPMLALKRVTLDYDLAGLMAGKAGGAISRVDVQSPSVRLVRRPDGKINILDILKITRKTKGPNFTGKASVRDAKVVFLDMSGKVGEPGQWLRVAANMDVDAADAPFAGFAAKVTGDGMQQALVTGYYDQDTRIIRADVNAAKLPADFWITYAKVPNAPRSLGGTIDVVAGMEYKPDTKPLENRFAAAVTLNDVWASVPERGVERVDVSGKVVTGGKDAMVDLVAKIDGGEAQITGTVSNPKDPTLDLAVVSNNLNIDRLVRLAGLSKQAAGMRVLGLSQTSARITGSAKNPWISAEMSIPKVMARGYGIENLKLQAEFRDGTVNLTSMRGNALGAYFQLTGRVSLKGKPSFNVTGRVDGFRLAGIRLPKDSPAVSGIASVSFEAHGTAENPVTIINLALDNGRVRNVSLGRVSGQMALNRKMLDIRALQIQGVAGGRISAQGRVNYDIRHLSLGAKALTSMNIDVEAQKVSFGRVFEILGVSGVRGTGFVSGKVSGKPTDPSFSGTAEMFAGKYKTYNADYLRVMLEGNKRAVTVNESIVRKYPGEAKFTGKVSLANLKRVEFEVAADVKRLSLTDILTMLDQKVDVECNIDGKVIAKGIVLPKEKSKLPLQGLDGSADIEISDAAAMGYAIDSGIAKFTIKNDKVDIERAQLKMEETALSFDGAVGIDTQDLNLKFLLSDFDFASVQDRIGGYVNILGTCQALGTVAGKWDNPSAYVSGEADELSINGKQFDMMRFETQFSENKLGKTKLELRRGEQNYDVNLASLDPKTQLLEGAYGKFSKVNIGDVWEMLLSSPYLSKEEAQPMRKALINVPRLNGGILSGTADVTGKLSAPEGSLNFTAQNLGIDTFNIDMITGEAHSKGGVVNLDSLVATAEDLNIQAWGAPLYDNGKTKSGLSLMNLDLSRFRTRVGDKTLGGLVAAEILVQGDVKSPEINGSLEIVTPEVFGIKLDGVRASNIKLKGDTIDLSNGILVSAGGHQASATGTIPWDWTAMTVPSDRQLALSANIKEQVVSLKDSPSPYINGPKTQATIAGQVDLGGTTVNPQLGGYLRVSDGAVVLKNFLNEFTGINMDLGFEGDKIKVNKFDIASVFTGKNRDGGRLYIEPGGYVSVGKSTLGDIDMLLVADKFRAAEKNLLGFKDDVSFQVDAGVAVKGNVRAPRIEDAKVEGKPSGVTVSNANISFALPEEMPKTRPSIPPIDPTFALSLNLGNNVRVKPPAMDILAVGGGTLGGRLSKPDLNMNIRIAQGQMGLAGTRMRVSPGGTVTVKYSPPEQPDLKVNLTATGHVTAQNQFGQRERYLITMVATGPIANMNISLSSDPEGLSKEQILASMGHVGGLLNQGEGQLKNELGNVLTAVGTSALLAPIEDIFVDQLGFEQFYVDYSRTESTTMFLERRLFGNFYGSYYQRLSSQTGSANPVSYEARLSYKLKGIYELSIGMDSQQNYSADFTITRRF